ncbi:hypothetical protein HOR19_gp03 [Phage MedPE-SWcel-C56]|uniref:Uncharacterized protein n=1 Tax=Phage MedPE-SWcel-C56 TaxID=1871314 RepID=A0A1B1IXY9_9CAUD|nr:hypothetical protein HOR19_gp03 [Phage MedPE-SWcel-C56]ANS06196.1 hypothetical protein [Phage MedPE-SWcel-C56]
MDYNALNKTDSDDSFALAVADINTRGKALQMDIQLYLHAVATRWKETGDVRPAVKRINMLVDKKQLFKGVRRNAIVAWVETNLGFEYITEGDNAHMFHANKAKAKGFELADLAVAKTFWFNATPEPDPAPVSLNVLLKAFVSKIDKRAAKHNAEDSIDPDQLAALRSLVKEDADPLEQGEPV